MLASIGHRGSGCAAWLLWCVLRRYRPAGIVRADVSPGGLLGCLVWRCPEDADCRCAGAVLPALLQARNLKVGLVLGTREAWPAGHGRPGHDHGTPAGRLAMRVTVHGAVSWLRPPGGGLFRGVVLGA